mgnify:CR=1 FL=1
MYKLSKENYASDNILSEEGLVKKIEESRKEGKIIGLCTGSFDLLHPGHITHLCSAKTFCDVLIVAIADDNFNMKKGRIKGRPIYSDYIRAYMISNLKSVDYVVIHDGSIEIFKIIKPEVHIKGPDYSDKNNPRIITQKHLLASWGGKIVYTQDEKLSTTDILEYIKRNI